MSWDDLHETLTKSVVRCEWPDEEVLIWMILLHLHEIVLRADVFIEGGSPLDGQPKVWAAITRSHAAKCVASVWPKTDERSNRGYWHGLYNLKTPFEDISEVPAEMVQKMLHFKELLKTNPIVHDVVLEIG